MINGNFECNVEDNNRFCLNVIASVGIRYV